MDTKQEKLAEFIGIMFGDGCLSRNSYVIYICGHKFDDRDYHEQYIISLLKILFNKDTVIHERNDSNCIFIRIYSKEIFTYLSNLGVPIGLKYSNLTIPRHIKNEWRLARKFIRGLVDTDGCMFLSKQHRDFYYYPRIEITSISKSFLLEILAILRQHNFYGSVSSKGKKGYRLEIPGFKNLNLWRQEIGFSNSKHSNKIEHIKINAPDPI